MGDASERFIARISMAHKPTPSHRASPADSSQTVDVDILPRKQGIVDGVEDAGHPLRRVRYARVEDWVPFPSNRYAQVGGPPFRKTRLGNHFMRFRQVDEVVRPRLQQGFQLFTRLAIVCWARIFSRRKAPRLDPIAVGYPAVLGIG